MSYSVFKRIACIIIVALLCFCLTRRSYAEFNIQQINRLKETIEKKKEIKNLEANLSTLSDFYFKQKKFNDLYDFLDLQSKKSTYRNNSIILYHKALTRFVQMRYLEENKLWEEYFEKKDLYIEQLKIALERIDKLDKDAIALKSKLMEWQLFKEDKEQSALLLDELFAVAKDFSQESEEKLEVIRQVAEDLFADKENNYGKKLYSIYVSKITDADISLERVKKLAEEFFDKAQFNLSVSLYDIYIEKILQNKSEDSIIPSISEMKKIAQKFAHPGWLEAPDGFFAESVYERMEKIMSRAVFDMKSQLSRAYNLERLKEYDLCVREYYNLLTRFPKYDEPDKVYFRLGVIYAYLLKDVPKAKTNLLKVMNDFSESVDYLNSCYHLGLLAHWSKDFEQAKKYYQIILAKAKKDSSENEITSLAKERLKEIEEKKDIEYNLRLFLTATLSEREQNYPMKLELFSRPAKNLIDKPMDFVVSSFTTDTGCLQPNFI